MSGERKTGLSKTTESRRSREALATWVESTLPRALAYAVSLVRNRSAAEDIVHDCYGRLLSKAADYDLPQDGERLLFKSISNACINDAARQPPEVSLESSERTLADTGTPGPESGLMQAELEEAVGAALAELSRTQRAIVELQSLGHSLVDVAEMLDLTHANVRVQLHRARGQLAERLQPYLEEKLP